MLIFYTAKPAAELMPGDQLLPGPDPFIADGSRHWPAMTVDRVSFEGQGVEVAGWPPTGRPTGPGRHYRKVRRYPERMTRVRLAVHPGTAVAAWTKIVNRACGADDHVPQDERATIEVGDDWSLGVRVGELRVWVGGAGELAPLLAEHWPRPVPDTDDVSDEQAGVIPALPDA